MRPPEGSHPPIGFAHRGARAHAPENTLGAFVLARRMGARAVETDVWLTADGAAVLDHDGVVRRGRRKVPIATLAARELPSHIPTFAELYRACGTDLDISLDLKDPAAAPEVLRTARRQGTDVLRRLWLCDPHMARLGAWGREAPGVRLVASVKRHRLTTDPSCRLDRLVGMGVDAVNLRGDTWSPGAVRRSHAAGLLAFAWNVQWGAHARLLLGWGVDALYSDHTDRLCRWLAPERVAGG